MPTLWLRSSDETDLPEVWASEQRDRLERIFDLWNPASVWRSAVQAAGLTFPGHLLKAPVPGSASGLIKWHQGTPYFNWTVIVEIVSCGTLEVVPTGEAGFAYRGRQGLWNLLSLLVAQWKMERFLGETALPAASAPDPAHESRLRESIALGLVLQALLLRLPRHSPDDLARWMAQPSQAPLAARRTVSRLQGIQKRRTQLSTVWREMFPAASSESRSEEIPEFFWDEPMPGGAGCRTPTRAENPGFQAIWKGLPVSPGNVTGRGELLLTHPVSPAAGARTVPRILIFPHARPEVTEVFQQADAVLFGKGSVLSHACTVAREMGIPCVTGLGQEFIRQIQRLEAKGQGFRITVEGEQGEVRLLPEE